MRFSFALLALLFSATVYADTDCQVTCVELHPKEVQMNGTWVTAKALYRQVKATVSMEGDSASEVSDAELRTFATETCLGELKKKCKNENYANCDERVTEESVSAFGEFASDTYHNVKVFSSSRSIPLSKAQHCEEN